MTQHEALTLLKMGNNTFITGSAGSGKTHVVNAFIQHLREHGVEVAVTASTGIAATHMGGVTIHAWSGIGIQTHLTDYDIDALEQKRHIFDRYKKTQVLIIDEVSMLSGTFLDTLDRVARALRRSEEPFGGIQIVLCGDLFQLPPITKENETTFIVESAVWNTMEPVVCYLQEQHRQHDDVFLSVLNAIRSGDVTEEHKQILRERLCEPATSDACITTLFTHNVDVDRINQERLDALSGESFTYTMQTKGKEALVEGLKKGCLAVPTLVLKKGAEVMFVKNNQEAGYVNGTRGIVVDVSMAREPIVETTAGKRIKVHPEEWVIEEDGKVKASIQQLPLRHAWAITIHKSQGMSLDAAVMDLSKTFTSGMGYVALSRVRSLSGLYLLGITRQALYIDEKVRRYDAQLREQSQAYQTFVQSLSKKSVQTKIEQAILTKGGHIHKDKNFGRIKKSTPKTASHMVTYDMVRAQEHLFDVATARSLTLGTVLSHLEKAKKEGNDVMFAHIALHSSDTARIQAALKKYVTLSETKKHLASLGHNYSFEEIRIARLCM